MDHAMAERSEPPVAEPLSGPRQYRRQYLAWHAWRFRSEIRGCNLFPIAAGSDWAGRWDRRPSFSKRHRTQWGKDCTPGSRSETAKRAKRGIAGGIAVGQRAARRQAARCARPSRGPWRDALLATGPRHTGINHRTGGAGAAGAIARATQPRAHQNGDETQSRIAPGSLLRYRLSPHCAGGRAGLRATLRVLRGGHPALRLSWHFLRIYRLGVAGARARNRQWSRRGGASRQWLL